MISSRDTRAKPIARSQLGVENQSFIYGLFADDTKYTVRDIYELARVAKQTENERPLNERTIRRAIDALAKGAFIIEAGRKENAVLYSKRSTRMTDDSQGLIPFAGELVSVEHFIELMVSPDLSPFKVKVEVANDEIKAIMRKQLAYAIITSGEAGHNDQLKKVMGNLEKIRAEFDHAAKALEGLLSSPIWYDQYRDGIGYQVRNMQKNNPELFQLAVDFIKGG